MKKNSLENIVLLLISLFMGLQQVEAKPFKRGGVWYDLMSYYTGESGSPVQVYAYKVVRPPSGEEPYVGEISIASEVTDPDPLYEDFIGKSLPVAAIDGLAFRDCVNITRVSLPSSLIGILSGAFMGCENLTQIQIPRSVQIIESYVFNGCNSLTSIEIPNSVEDYSADLTSCEGLTEVIFEDGEKPLNLNSTKIGGKNVKTLYWGRNIEKSMYGETFATLGGEALEKVTIGGSVTFLPAGAFQSCTNLKEVIWKNSLKEIGRATFYKCTALESIDLPSGLQVIGKNAFDNCTNLQRVNSQQDGQFIIPNGVVKVLSYAFDGCSSLREVIIPSTCEEIASSAFRNISTITKVTCRAETPPVISDFTFTPATYNKATLVCPSPDSYSVADGWKNFFNIISEVEDLVSVSAPRTDISQKGNHVYDLSGRRIHHINSAPKGLYIVNGRAVVK